MDVDKADKQNANPKHVDEYIPDPNGIYRDKRGNRYRKNSDYDKNAIPHTASTARLAHRHTLYG